jgi:hypothetical protein
MGSALLACGRFEDAENHFEAVIDLTEEYEQTLAPSDRKDDGNALGLITQRVIDDDTQAFDALHRLRVRAFYGLGQCYLALGLDEQAEVRAGLLRPCWPSDSAARAHTRTHVT